MMIAEDNKMNTIEAAKDLLIRMHLATSRAVVAAIINSLTEDELCAMVRLSAIILDARGCGLD